ncbi:MAG: hypothetical protein KBG15_24435 [Kofleriaceae bacterium]|nr:hypothetical protein [Kofleriaceae bacterium]
MTYKSLIMAAALGATLTSASCKKEDRATPRAVASGVLTPAETELLKHLPAGSQAVFGGNMFKMQKWFAESPLGKLSQQMMDPKMTAYNTCLVKLSDTMQVVGSMRFASGGMTTRVFMHNFTIAALAKCATDAQLSIELADDGKFVVITTEIMNIKSTAPYLAVDGGVYGGNSVAGLGSTEVTAAPRAALEAEVASLANASVATDSKLALLLNKINRKANFWVVGSAANTPAAATVGDFYMTFGMADGLAIDGTVALIDSSDSEKVMRGVGEMKSKLDSIPANMNSLKEVLRALTVEKNNDGIRFGLKASNSQLEAVVTQVEPMMQQFMPK